MNNVSVIGLIFLYLGILLLLKIFCVVYNSFVGGILDIFGNLSV